MRVVTGHGRISVLKRVGAGQSGGVGAASLGCECMSLVHQ